MSDLVKRLRNTPNWMREGFQDWKDNVRTYDRTPFEAADRIEELEAELEYWREESDLGWDKAEERRAELAKALELAEEAFDFNIEDADPRAWHSINDRIEELKGQEDD